jgi:hypothetical protein
VRRVLIPLALAACCHGAAGMRLLPVPEYGELSVDLEVRMEEGRRCVAPRGTTVEVVGTTTSMEPPPTEMVLVRALAGPCAGGRATIEARLLVDVRATPERSKADRR